MTETEASTSNQETETSIYIFIHLGSRDAESSKILSYLKNNNIRGISPILFTETVKNRLLKNKEGITVDEVPCFIIKEGNKTPEIYPISRMNDVIRKYKIFLGTNNV